jgi:hypothetical protein
VWESRFLDGPDGIAIARSGNVYVALALANQVVKLSPDFRELARTPPNPPANREEEIPLDGPASMAFQGQRLLVSNQSPLRADPASWAILDVHAGEAGLPLHHPRIFRPKLRLEARAVSSRGRTHIRVRVTRSLAALAVPVADAVVRARGARTRTNPIGRGSLRLGHKARGRIVVTARKRGFAKAAVAVKARSKRFRR